MKQNVLIRLTSRIRRFPFSAATLLSRSAFSRASSSRRRSSSSRSSMPLFSISSTVGSSPVSAKAGKDVSLDINNYASGADSNLVALVDTSIMGATKLIATAAEAYVKVAGGGAQADTALATGKKIYDFFASKGGDAEKAKVTTDTAANTVKVDDGSTCITCDAAGNCTDCSVK